jgi:type II secretory pathway pseudopilin PulG
MISLPPTAADFTRISQAKHKISLLTHQKGAFTLLEVLLSIVLLSAGLLALIWLLSFSFAASSEPESLLLATNLGRARIEELRNLDFDSGLVNETKATVDDFANFQREVTVTPLQTGLKQISVKVYWQHKGTQQNIELVSYFSKD